MSEPRPYLVKVTDTRVTEYIIHAIDPGEAIRDTWKRGVEVCSNGEITANANAIAETQYDQMLSGLTSTEQVEVWEVPNV